MTPSLDPGTILPGVTRASIIELAKNELGCTVIESSQVRLSDLNDATEAFCCGTGASITPVGSINVANLVIDDDNDDDDNDDGSREKDKKKEEDDFVAIQFGDGTTPGPLTQRLYKMLLDLQTGVDETLNEKYSDWIHIVEP